MESFLYHKLNSIMRLVADEKHYSVWLHKIETFEPFALLLNNHIDESKSDKSKIVYRDAYLTDEMIQNYYTAIRRPKDLNEDDDMTPSFPAFTSCSRNRAKAEEYENVLFIIELIFNRSVDVSQFSDYPDEEEEIIKPGVLFVIENIEYDSECGKHLIDLSII
ncbi:hypothetical protein I4U23_005851 [Adineta vaga]|nr:hypothetical protein I4U23_005851 [Adineta vaga]